MVVTPLVTFLYNTFVYLSKNKIKNSGLFSSSWVLMIEFLQDPLEPVMPFTKPLIPDKLAAAGIVPPTNASKPSGTGRSTPFRGRIGRGGRIIFDRWNPLMHTPVNCGDSFYLSPRQQPSPRFG